VQQLVEGVCECNHTYGFLLLPDLKLGTQRVVIFVVAPGIL